MFHKSSYLPLSLSFFSLPTSDTTNEGKQKNIQIHSFVIHSSRESYTNRFIMVFKMSNEEYPIEIVYLYP